MRISFDTTSLTPPGPLSRVYMDDDQFVASDYINMGYTTYEVVCIGGGGGISNGGYIFVDGVKNSQSGEWYYCGGSGGGGGGYMRVAGSLNSLVAAEPIPITVGKASGGASPGTAWFKGLRTDWLDLTASTTLDGQDGQASSFGDICMASGGKGGKKGINTGTDPFWIMTAGDGGIGGTTVAGGGGKGGQSSRNGGSTYQFPAENGTASISGGAEIGKGGGGGGAAVVYYKNTNPVTFQWIAPWNISGSQVGALGNVGSVGPAFCNPSVSSLQWEEYYNADEAYEGGGGGGASIVAITGVQEYHGFGTAPYSPFYPASGSNGSVAIRLTAG